MGDAALAVVRDAQLLGGAGVAGEGDDVHQGVLEVLLRFLGGAQILADGDGLPGVADVQPQGQPDPLLDDGPLQEHVVAVLGHVALDHLQGNLVQQTGVPILEGQLRHLLEYGAADVVNRAVYSSHSSLLLFFQAGGPPVNCEKSNHIWSKAIIADVSSHCKRFLLGSNRLNGKKSGGEFVRNKKDRRTGKVPPPAAKREKKQKERKSCLLLGG